MRGLPAALTDTPHLQAKKAINEMAEFMSTLAADRNSDRTAMAGRRAKSDVRYSR